MRKFKTGEELSTFVKQQINEELTFIKTVKPRKGICYMEIPDKTVVWSLLNKVGIKADKHGNFGYYVYLV